MDWQMDERGDLTTRHSDGTVASIRQFRDDDGFYWSVAYTDTDGTVGFDHRDYETEEAAKASVEDNWFDPGPDEPAPDEWLDMAYESRFEPDYSVD